jgi:AcrR family transcriptional regulator
MARARFYRAEPERQEALLQAAAKEIAANGYNGASLNRIIETAGLSKGAFYYYFDDKADLAATVLEYTYEHTMQALRRVKLPDDAADFWPAFERVVRDSLADLVRTPMQAEFVGQMATAFFRHPELGERLDPLICEARRFGEKLWRHGQELGAVRRDFPPELLNALLQAVKEVLIRFCWPSETAATPAELDHYVSLQMDLARRLASPADRAKPDRRAKTKPIKKEARR